jgi:DNA-binding Xre family transcriptional regulator
MPIRSVLFAFWQQKEIELGRRVTVSEVARAANIHRDAIQRLLDNESTRFDGPTLAAICRFFGVPPGPIPFLEFVPDEGDGD